MRKQRIEKLLQMLAQNEQDTFVLYALGMEFEGLNKFDEALNYFNKVLLIEPQRIAVYYRMAIIMQETGNDKEALSLLNLGMELLKSSNDQKTKNEFRTLMDDIAS